MKVIHERRILDIAACLGMLAVILDAYHVVAFRWQLDRSEAGKLYCADSAATPVLGCGCTLRVFPGDWIAQKRHSDPEALWNLPAGVMVVIVVVAAQVGKHFLHQQIVDWSSNLATLDDYFPSLMSY